MLTGIDISNWQKSINLNDVFVHNPNLDFVICKATEGTNYVDKCCDGFVQTTRANGVLYGFYHFARNNDPLKEAEYFVDMCSNYFGEGVPILDIEDDQIIDWKGYVDSFTKRVHDLTNVWPMVYCSAGHLAKLRGCDTSKRCALWVAGYPKPAYGFADMETIPYNTAPWLTWTLWQFTSSGNLRGYNGDLDLDFGNLTKEGWQRIANGDRDGAAKAQPSEELLQALQVVADHVIAGEYGVGDERKEMLYNAIQEQVNLRVIY